MGALDRYAQIEAELAGVEAPAPNAANQPTAVHRQVVELLDELLGLVPAGAGPAPLLLRTLRAAEPMLLADLAKVPAEALVEFLHSLGARFNSIGAGECRTSAESA